MPKKFPDSEDPLKKMKSVWFSHPPVEAAVQKNDAPLVETKTTPVEWTEPAKEIPEEKPIEAPQAKPELKKGFEHSNRRTVLYLGLDQPLRIRCLAKMKRKTTINYFIQDILEAYLSQPENQRLIRDFKRLYPEEYEALKLKF